ncbi:hypothetical protein NQ117_09560 [Paenibacillus sp. SC116]|uniref:hypothetical protein n=1 Tax=Paenibacillus sp. SC116 TaxID=2968986 RepID=UPI00215B06F3|nr:hypothetical protein [Paenibacillus sp. SC116]MCR8843934.1 hypothetical protein [Paenibacillus sp. SC116]
MDAAQKEMLEKQHAQSMNDKAVERIKQESSEVNANVWLEEGKQIQLLDGKTYNVRPSKLLHARKLMKLLGTVSMEVVILNFMETDSPEEDETRINNFYDALMIAFTDYPHVTKEYLELHCDVVGARNILDVLVGLNGLKK